MPVIKLVTHINAAPEIVFDLSRSIDLHKISTAHTKEEAVGGKTSGLIGLGELVTWKARHLGFTQTLSSKVTAFNYPYSFTDEMVDGVFKSFRHDHFFEDKKGLTIMTDIFAYKSPLGIIGKLADIVFLKNYMEYFLKERIAVIKEYAEDSNKYKKILT